MTMGTRAIENIIISKTTRIKDKKLAFTIQVFKNSKQNMSHDKYYKHKKKCEESY